MFININTGYIHLRVEDFFSDTELHPIAILRIYRVVAMLFVGMAIPTSGFLLQEYFQNPLAGPSVLGITSVASLSVAIFIFFFSQDNIAEFWYNGGMSFFALVGSLTLMSILVGIGQWFRSSSSLIILGFLISALAGAIISFLQLYAENQNLKNYILWSFGANQQLNFNQTLILAELVMLGLGLSFRAIKPLIGNSLGHAYAQSLGVNLKNLQMCIIIASSLLVASITSFLGPILFIGIVVPHFCRMLFTPALLWQQWILNMSLGTALMLGLSIISERYSIPINVISSFFGIPVIFFMVKSSKNKTL